MPSKIEKNLKSILDRIASAAQKSGRTAENVTLVAVSKKQPLMKINEFIEVADGIGLQVILGENYVQEYRDKREQFSRKVKAHLIGHLQKNKAALAVELFDVVETVDSLKLARALDKQAARSGRSLRVLLQVNISEDDSKSGLIPSEVKELVSTISKECLSLSLEGLMAITRFYTEPEQARGDFRALATLRARIEQESGIPLPELSIGMSSDFEVAIEEGATFVRIGSSLFGERSY